MPATRGSTRQQTRQELLPSVANLKRSAIDSPEKQPNRKRSALGDVTNAIGNVLIDSSKKQNGGKLPPTNRPPRARRSSESNKQQRHLPTVLETAADLTNIRGHIIEEQDSTYLEPLSLLNSDSSSEEGIAGLKRPSSSSSDSEIECRRRSSGPHVRPSIKANKVEKEGAAAECDYDFDLENILDPFHLPQYANDIFKYYKCREKRFHVDDFLARQTSINAPMRSVLIDWMVEIQENFELNHETLYQSVKMTDLYLKHHCVVKEKLQLVGATALFISCKFDERQPPCLDDFLYICDDAYSREELIECEKKVLQTLDFDIGMPSSYRFLRRYAKVSKVSMEVLTLGRYILETALLFYEFVSVSDSLLAAAAFLLSIKMKDAGEWDGVKIKYSGYVEKDLEAMMWKLNDMLHTAMQQNDLLTVRNKYSHQ